MSTSVRLLLAVTSMLVVMQPVMADTAPRVDQLSDELFHFNFRHQSNLSDVNSLSEERNTDLSFDDGLLEKSSLPTRYLQYDAIFSYPLGLSSVSLDLGLTVRHLRGWSSTISGESQHFQTTLPLFHASARVALPLRGLTAGFEGSHMQMDDNRVMDYKAKLSYEWTTDFGLEGGWKHQQFNLENGSEQGTEYENRGPFVDFYLRF